MRVLYSVVFCALLGLGAAQLPANQADPCTNKHGLAKDNTHCDRYWECSQLGESHLYDCPNGLIYVGRNRGIAEGCDYPHRSGSCHNKQLANAPISTEHCDWLYGIFGHETSCTRYWTCWNGTATEQFCIGGLLYNEDTHACDWPQNVKGCQKHPLCKDDPNANVPLGQSCERYWSCQGGYPRLQRCPATLVFDRISRRCVNPPTADCAVPSTTPQPERQSAFREGGGPPRGNSPNRARKPQKNQGASRPAIRQQQFDDQQFIDNTEQFDDNRNQFIAIDEAPLQPVQQRPRTQQTQPLVRRPPIPSGAIPIPFNNQRNARPAPIQGSVALK